MGKLFFIYAFCTLAFLSRATAQISSSPLRCAKITHFSGTVAEGWSFALCLRDASSMTGCQTYAQRYPKNYENMALSQQRFTLVQSALQKGEFLCLGNVSWRVSSEDLTGQPGDRRPTPPVVKNGGPGASS